MATAIPTHDCGGMAMSKPDQAGNERGDHMNSRPASRFWRLNCGSIGGDIAETLPKLPQISDPVSY